MGTSGGRSKGKRSLFCVTSNKLELKKEGKERGEGGKKRTQKKKYDKECR